MLSVTIAATLTAYYPEHIWIPLVAYPLAASIALGMISGDHHWASDVVGGAIIGQTIGYTIGRAFHERARRSPEPGQHSQAKRTVWDSVTIIPVEGAYHGVLVSAVF